MQYEEESSAGVVQANTLNVIRGIERESKKLTVKHKLDYYVSDADLFDLFIQYI